MDQYIYYVYVYLRKKDLTPYYIGKGKNTRAFDKDHNVKVPTRDRIKILAKSLNEHEAHLLEMKMISEFGRKDLGTGILRNLTDGGDGVSGYWTAERKEAFSAARSGKGNPMYGTSRPDVSARCGHLNHNYGKVGELSPLFGTKRPDHSKIMSGDLNPMKRPELKEFMSKRMAGSNNPMFGKTGSADHLNSIKLQCKHCGKLSSLGNHARWHDDNCKHKG